MKTVRSQPEPKMTPPPSPEAVKAEPKERIKRERRRSMEQNPEENIYKKVKKINWGLKDLGEFSTYFLDSNVLFLFLKKLEEY